MEGIGIGIRMRGYLRLEEMMLVDILSCGYLYIKGSWSLQMEIDREPFGEH
jgi:hypothetical protein